MKLFKNKWFLFFLVLVLAGGGYYGYTRYQATQEAAQAPAEEELKTAKVRRGDLVLYASGSGNLAPAYEVSFGFETSGKVVEVLAEVGDRVEEGALLARLDDTDARLRLEQAQRTLRELTSPSALAEAEYELAAAEDNLDEKKGHLIWLVSLGVFNWTERLQQAQAHLAELKAEYGDNPTEAQQEEIKAAERAVKEAEISLKISQRYYEDTYIVETFAQTVTNPRTGEEQIVYEYNPDTGQKEPVVYPPTEYEINLAWADYHRAQARLQEAQWYLAALKGETLPPEASGEKLAQLEAARQELAEAQQALADTELRAPVSGTITTFNIAVGQQVSNTANVVTIADLAHPYVEVYLDEIDWDKIAPGYDAEITFDAVEDKTYTGKVVWVDPALVNESGTMLVHGLVALDINQSGLGLPLGAAAAVDVIGGKAENVLLVPVEALREISPGQYAVFVLENGEPTLRMVEVGLKDMFYAEIKSGLEAGEIVTTGLVETEK